MRIALIQQRATDDRQDNISRGLAAVSEAARQGAQVICFAELALEPFYPQEPAGPNKAGLAEAIPGPVTDAFSLLARKHGVVIILNIFELDGRQTFDTSPVIT